MTRQPTGHAERDLSVAAARRNNSQLSRSMILQAALAIIDRDGDAVPAPAQQGRTA
jgi:hypothetical protein